jgi:hypothetical protein
MACAQVEDAVVLMLPPTAALLVVVNTRLLRYRKDDMSSISQAA